MKTDFMQETIKNPEKEKENPDNTSVKEAPENKQTKKTNDSLITWIILAVGLVAILTLVVLIGLKLQKSKKAAVLNNASVVNNAPAQKETATEIANAPTQASKPLTKEELLQQALYYPNTISEKETDWDPKFLYYTNDSVTTAYDYYEELISLNNWELGTSGMATDLSGGFLNVSQNDFSAEIRIRESTDEAGPTEIDITVYNKEEVPLTSTLNRPSLEPEEPTQPTPPPDEKPAQASEQDDYILPFSNSRKIVREDLSGLTDWQLKVARNEIYARHGRSFVHQDLTCYFNKLPWYEINPAYSENKLSSLEISNAVFILNYEKEIKSSLLDKDTGCI